MKRSSFIKASILSLGAIITASIPKMVFPRSNNKVITLDDIHGGVYITRHTQEAKVSYMYQIGYTMNAASRTRRYKHLMGKYVLNSIADGWVCNNLDWGFTKEQLLEHIINNGYRLATKEEVIEAISKCDKNFR